MKKLFFLSAATFILVAAAHAQTNVALVKNEIKSDKKQELAMKKEKREERKELKKLEGKVVSDQSKQAFYRDFGKAPVSKWKRNANFDEATFIKDGEVTTAYYDADSKLVGTTSQKTFADLPAAAQKSINAKYKGYSKAGVVFFDDNEANETDMIMYGTQLDDADNYFVELEKDNKGIILQVDMRGNVTFFKQVK
jgi:hypothetical protein